MARCFETEVTLGTNKVFVEIEEKDKAVILIPDNSTVIDKIKGSYILRSPGITEKHFTVQITKLSRMIIGPFERNTATKIANKINGLVSRIEAREIN